MEDVKKILDAAEFMHSSQGYVDSNSVANMTGIPALVVENVLSQNGYKVSGVASQYLKSEL